MSTIRVSVQRALSHSEKEWIAFDGQGLKSETIMFTQWDGVHYKFTVYPFTVRISARGKFWLHSDTLDSRGLYYAFLTFLEDNFVNIHPIAVRTFSDSASPKKSAVQRDRPIRQEAMEEVDLSEEETEALDEILRWEESKKKEVEEVDLSEEEALADWDVAVLAQSKERLAQSKGKKKGKKKPRG